MIDAPIKILLIEDDPGDVRLVQEFLAQGKGTRFALSHRPSLAEGREAISGERFALILLDLNLPDSLGLDTLVKVAASAPNLPVLVLTGWNDEEVGLEALRLGAQDYLVKGEFEAELLRRAIRYGLGRHQAEAALKESERRYRQLVELAQEGIWAVDAAGVTTYVNPRLTEMLGHPAGDMVGRPWFDFMDDNGRALAAQKIERHQRGHTEQFDLELITKDGQRIYTNVQSSPVTEEKGRYAGTIALISDITARKRSEEDLRRSEQHFRLLIENAPDAILIQTKGRVAYGNAMAVKLFAAASGQELLGVPIKSLTAPESMDFAKDRIHALNVLRQAVPNASFGFRRLDGSTFAGEASAVPIVYHDQPGALSFIRDVTARHEAAAALEKSYREVQRSKAETASLLQASRAILDSGGFPETARRIFQAAKETIGATAGYVALRGDAEDDNEVLFLDSDGLPGEVDPALPRPLRDLRERAYLTRTAVYENDFSTSPWATFPPPGRAALQNVLFAPLILEDQAAGLVGLANKPGGFGADDARLAGAFAELAAIALRNSRAQEMLATSEGRFRQLAETIQEVFWTRDMKSGRLLYVSPAYEEIWGRRPADLIAGGHEFLDTIHPQDRDLVSRAIQGRDGPGPWEEEYRIVRPDGMTRWVSAKTFPVVDEHGRVVRMVGVAADITDRKAAATEKEKLEAHLRQAQKMEAIGTLAGGIAHDFNNILAAIIGYSELAIASLPAGSSAGDDLEQILRAANRAKSLVKQILHFSRRGENQKKPIKISMIVKEALRLLRSTLPTTIEIRQELSAPAAIVLADQTQVHQILMNLGTNAAHAMQAGGGVLTVKLESLDLAETDVARYHNLAAGRYVRLSVGDTGCGMERRTLERIFEPFFTTKGPGEGSGMGLAVVHGIVKDHGGDISVYSETGRGSEFRILLPEIKSAADQQEKVEPPVAPRGSERILLVDDEESLVSLGQVMLKTLGYDVTALTSSQEAFELFRQKPHDFDVIITDQTMPRMTGANLAREFLKIRPEIPIILCTGFSDQITAERAQGLGIRRFVLKPWSLREIAQVIREVVENQAGQPAENK